MIELGNLHFEVSKRGFYVDALIFDTKEEMHNYIANHGSDHRGCLAISLGYTTINSKGNLTKRLGTLCFYKGYCGAGAVAHECGHAVFNYARTKRKTDYISEVSDDSTTHDEELYCDSLGWLVSQFWEKYYAICPDL